ncbi:MAG: integron integrase [Gemmatimonadetes bacterium]|nr:integron integrase [Gemmatimonadota bacterium]
MRIRTRHLSRRTESTYLAWIRRYIAHFGGLHPATLGRADVETFIEQLAQGQGLGSGSQNQAASAIVFLYRELFGVDFGGRKGVSRAQASKVLPKYASADEVDLVMARLREPHRVAAMIMYGSGTRVSETISLRIKDLSLGSGELIVRAGKGAKDRTTVIPRSAMPALRRQIQRVEEGHLEDLEAGRGWARLPSALHRKDPRAGWEFGWQFLFPSPKLTRDPKTGHLGRAPIHVTTVQRAIKGAARAAKVHRPISCHVLRHCFATEMLRAGCDIRLLQRLMGHRDLKTTSRYLHIINRPGLNVISPLDRLPSFKAALEQEAPTSPGSMSD